MRTLFLPHTEVVQRLDALSLLAPMREGFQAHSAGRTAPGLVRATPLPDGGIARVTGVGLLPDVPAYSVSSAATSAEGAEQATLLLHDRGTGKVLACLDAVHLRDGEPEDVRVPRDHRAFDDGAIDLEPGRVDGPHRSSSVSSRTR